MPVKVFINLYVKQMSRLRLYVKQQDSFSEIEDASSFTQSAPSRQVWFKQTHIGCTSGTSPTSEKNSRCLQVNSIVYYELGYVKQFDRGKKTKCKVCKGYRNQEITSEKDIKY